MFNAAFEQTNQTRRLFDGYKNGKYLPSKNDSYFHVDEKLFGKYVGKEIIFAEGGVSDDGGIMVGEGDEIYPASFFESIVCMHVDRKKCFISSSVTNNGISENAKDFRYKGTLQEFLFRVKRVFNQIPLLGYLSNPVLLFLIYVVSWVESLTFKQYFN